jgi:hypothetical protein
MDILVYDGSTYLKTITVEDPANIEETFFYDSPNLQISAMSNQYYPKESMNAKWNWNYMDNSDIIDILTLIGMQSRYKLYYASKYSLHNIYFDGDVLFENDSVLDVSNLSIGVISL